MRYCNRKLTYEYSIVLLSTSTNLGECDKTQMVNNSLRHNSSRQFTSRQITFSELIYRVLSCVRLLCNRARELLEEITLHVHRRALHIRARAAVFHCSCHSLPAPSFTLPVLSLCRLSQHLSLSLSLSASSLAERLVSASASASTSSLASASARSSFGFIFN